MDSRRKRKMSGGEPHVDLEKFELFKDLRKAEKRIWDAEKHSTESRVNWDEEKAEIVAMRERLTNITRSLLAQFLVCKTGVEKCDPRVLAIGMEFLSLRYHIEQKALAGA
jgi:hypothetical protein